LSVPGNLSRVSWKLSRTVLRGGTNSNAGPLLGKRQGSVKQPYCFEVNEGQLFAFAGLWEGWKANGTWVKTCTILTTTPNAMTSVVHDRMPVILDPADYDVWLDPGMKDSVGVSELLKPFDASLMRCYAVSNRVNNVQNDDAECSLPVAPEVLPQQQLFP